MATQAPPDALHVVREHGVEVVETVLAAGIGQVPGVLGVEVQEEGPRRFLIRAALPHVRQRAPVPVDGEITRAPAARRGQRLPSRPGVVARRLRAPEVFLARAHAGDGIVGQQRHGHAVPVDANRARTRHPVEVVEVVPLLPAQRGQVPNVAGVDVQEEVRSALLGLLRRASVPHPGQPASVAIDVVAPARHRFPGQRLPSGLPEVRHRIDHAAERVRVEAHVVGAARTAPGGGGKKEEVAVAGAEVPRAHEPLPILRREQLIGNPARSEEAPEQRPGRMGLEDAGDDGPMGVEIVDHPRTRTPAAPDVVRSVRALK